MDMKMKENRSTREKTENANAVSYTVTMKPIRKEHPEEMAEESLTRLIESYRRAPYPSEITILDIDEVVYERMTRLVQAIGREDVMTGSFVSRVIFEHLEKHADLIRKIEEQDPKRQ